MPDFIALDAGQTAARFHTGIHHEVLVRVTAEHSYLCEDGTRYPDQPV